jgi:hypothetical protein
VISTSIKAKVFIGKKTKMKIINFLIIKSLY